MTVSREKSSRLSDVLNENRKEELIKYENTGTSRDWMDERKRKSSPEMDYRHKERSPVRERDTRYDDRNREDYRERNSDRDRSTERDSYKQRTPLKRSYRSPGRSARMGPRSPERDYRDHRRERPRDREEREHMSDSRDATRHSVRSYGRERRSPADRNESRYGREVDRYRSSPPIRGSKDSYSDRERERDTWRRERSREPPSWSGSKRSPYRDRKQTGNDQYREHSTHSKARSPVHHRRDESPKRRSPPSRDYSLVKRSPTFLRDPSTQRRGSPRRGIFEKETYTRYTERNRMSPPIPSYNTRGRDVYPVRAGLRNEGYFDSRERHSPDRDRTEYSDEANTPRGKAASRTVFDRISLHNRDNIDNRKRVSSGSNRPARSINQHFPENTVSTLRDLSDRPVKRDRGGEDPPPPSTIPPESWVEEKKARIRSRVEAEDILDMELIILSEKQREYAEKVEQRIRHMGVTTNLITLPPSMGVAESLDRAVRRNLLYAIIILPQHEQHNSITLTILHGKNPQEHKNMPLEDALCLINIDHQKYEEAIRDRIIQSRDPPEMIRSSREAGSSPRSTPEKHSLDLEQLSQIVKKFPPSKSDLNQNSKDLQAKILGLLGSSAIIPSNDNMVDTSQQLPFDEPNMALPPITPFTPMHGFPPHAMLGPPNLMPSFPPIPFNFSPGPMSPMPFHPSGVYMQHPNILGHPPPFHGGFYPRP
ncbi:Nuclear receptor coactivator 5-like [Oopsacas minuta]|uniref:Nuclear receptor coactivator 5-like n=1 Tax=Oopsacas minuta TaxID=111878 RepID=A0AAV7JI07_9METZ|nr:Nuclear receptor coactivator 5-like [Oopsacas minuta]